MSDDSASRRGVPAWVWPLLIAIPFLYVAAFGPVIWGIIRIDSSGSPYAQTLAGGLMLPYIPLVMLGHQFEPLGAALNWYVQLFEPSAYIFSPPPAAFPPAGVP
jgi:hypothetical protein